MTQWHTSTGYHQLQHPVPFSGCFGTTTTGAQGVTGVGGAAAVAPSIDVFQEHLPLEMLMDVAPLDRGGFCVVCSCTYLGRRAVLKVPKLDGPDSAVADLLMEISIYRRISERGGHPNIAQAYGSGFHLVEGRPTPFLVLELLEGGNLAKALEQSRPKSDTWSDPIPRLPVALELADALQFLHFEAVPSGFVLHRDLKPTNIGLCGNGHVKLFDLGLSVVQEVREGSIDQKYQMSGMAGSKRFMSPEVCKGLPYNEKADVYSFGIVLWELCTLRKPFAGMNVEEHYREVITGGLRPPLDPRWPAALQHFLRRNYYAVATAPRPEYRWCGVEQVDEAAPIPTRSNGWRYRGPREGGETYRRQAVFGAGFRLRLPFPRLSSGPGHRWFNSHPLGGDPDLPDFRAWARTMLRRRLVHRNDADAWRAAFVEVEGGGHGQLVVSAADDINL
eukprot:g5564.t1